MDIEVDRNAYGRQVDSFEADIDVPALGAAPFHAVFIRAPVVASVGAGVEVLARMRTGGDGGAAGRRATGVAAGDVVPPGADGRHAVPPLLPGNRAVAGEAVLASK